MLHVSTKHYRHAVMLTALLLFCAARAIALPISDYHQNIKQAIAELEGLVEKYEGEGDYGAEVTPTLDKVRGSRQAMYLSTSTINGCTKRWSSLAILPPTSITKTLLYLSNICRPSKYA